MFYPGDNSTFADTTGRLLDGFEDERLMQFTGIKDKNGTGQEIYEGDVLRRTKTGSLWLVEFSDGSFGAKCLTFDQMGYGDWYGFATISFQDEEWLIIGNIYENEELLTTASPSASSASDTN
jgi:uncharacterized phage protein (TIGR01671 family)